MKNSIFTLLLITHYFLFYTQIHYYEDSHKLIDSLKKYNISYTITNIPKTIARLPFIRDSIMNQQKQLEKNQIKKTHYLIDYVNYIQKITDTTIQWFIKNDNNIKFYPCYLAPYAEYCIKQKITGYCEEASEHLYKLLTNNKILTKNKKNTPTIPFNPSNILPLSEMVYIYNYDSKKNQYQQPNDRCVFNKHSCLIVDVLKTDESKKIMFILTFNFPGKYYSLFMYDYQNGYLIPDIQLLYKIDLNKLNTHSSKTYFAYWANQLLAYAKDCTIRPIIPLYQLFLLYDKMNIKSIYYITYKNQKEKESHSVSPSTSK